MTLTQWITGRLMAQGIRGLVHIGRSVFGSRAGPVEVSSHNSGDVEYALTEAEAYANSVKSNLHCSQGRTTGRPEHDVEQ